MEVDALPRAPRKKSKEVDGLQGRPAEQNRVQVATLRGPPKTKRKWLEVPVSHDPPLLCTGKPMLPVLPPPSSQKAWFQGLPPLAGPARLNLPPLLNSMPKARFQGLLKRREVRKLLEFQAKNKKVKSPGLHKRRVARKLLVSQAPTKKVKSPGLLKRRVARMLLEFLALNRKVILSEPVCPVPRRAMKSVVPLLLLEDRPQLLLHPCTPLENFPARLSLLLPLMERQLACPPCMPLANFPVHLSLLLHLADPRMKPQKTQKKKSPSHLSLLLLLMERQLACPLCMPLEHSPAHLSLLLHLADPRMKPQKTQKKKSPGHLSLLLLLTERQPANRPRLSLEHLRQLLSLALQ